MLQVLPFSYCSVSPQKWLTDCSDHPEIAELKAQSPVDSEAAFKLSINKESFITILIMAYECSKVEMKMKHALHSKGFSWWKSWMLRNHCKDLCIWYSMWRSVVNQGTTYLPRTPSSLLQYSTLWTLWPPLLRLSTKLHLGSPFLTYGLSTPQCRKLDDYSSSTCISHLSVSLSCVIW